MINLLKNAILWLSLCFLASCQSDVFIDEPPVNSSENMLTLNSPMTEDDFMNACITLKSHIGSSSRAVQLTEAEAKKAVTPFVQDGKILKAQIVKQVEYNASLRTEANYFKNLSDEGCAALSFVYHTINNVGKDTGSGNDINSVSLQKKVIDVNRLFHCAAVAVGYDFLKKLSVKGVISAVTVRQAIIAIGKRYLGYVGVMLMVADFVGCVG